METLRLIVSLAMVAIGVWIGYHMILSMRDGGKDIRNPKAWLAAYPLWVAIMFVMIGGVGILKSFSILNVIDRTFSSVYAQTGRMKMVEITAAGLQSDAETVSGLFSDDVELSEAAGELRESNILDEAERGTGEEFSFSVPTATLPPPTPLPTPKCENELVVDNPLDAWASVFANDNIGKPSSPKTRSLRSIPNGVTCSAQSASTTWLHDEVNEAWKIICRLTSRVLTDPDKYGSRELDVNGIFVRDLEMNHNGASVTGTGPWPSGIFRKKCEGDAVSGESGFPALSMSLPITTPVARQSTLAGRLIVTFPNLPCRKSPEDMDSDDYLARGEILTYDTMSERIKVGDWVFIEATASSGEACWVPYGISMFTEALP